MQKNLLNGCGTARRPAPLYLALGMPKLVALVEGFLTEDRFGTARHPGAGAGAIPVQLPPGLDALGRETG